MVAPRRTPTPPTTQEVKASLTAAATENLGSSLQVKLSADSVVRRVAEITAPADAANMANDARQVAQDAIAAVDDVRTAWEAFQSSTDANDVQSAAIKMSGKAAEANAFITQAQRLLEEAETLARQVKSDEDLTAEVVRFREEVFDAENAIRRIFQKVGEINKNTPTTESSAAVAVLEPLKNDVATDYTNVRHAEDNALAAVNRTALEAAHRDGQVARNAAQTKQRRAIDEEVKMSRVELPPPAPRTQVLQLAKTNWGVVALSSLAIATVFFFEFLAIKHRLPEGEWYLVPMLVFLFFASAAIGGLIKNKGWNRQIVVSLITTQVVFIVAFISLGAFVDSKDVVAMGHGPKRDIYVMNGGGTPMVMWIILAMLILIIVAAIVAAVMWRRQRAATP